MNRARAWIVQLREDQYRMIGPSQINYVRATGVLPPGSVSRVIAAARSSGDFRLVAPDANALLFRLVTT
jgi:hypothetical protein